MTLRLQEEYMLTEEGFKIRVAALRKEEEALSRERERLERDKARRGTRLIAYPCISTLTVVAALVVRSCASCAK
jgi:hypothetical protein